MILDGSNGVTFNDASLQGAAASPFGLKNRLINADMRIDQRNAGASVTLTTLYNTYTLDRWVGTITQASKYSVQQNAGSVTPPVGFSNYLGVTSLSAYSVISSDVFSVAQMIEGFNVADLGWGTANAKTITISFWVRSSLTGTFGGSISNNSQDRSYPFSYTISAANTWEQKSITVAGDTTGTWLTTNGIGLRLQYSLGVGSSSLGTANTWAASNLYAPTGSVSVVGTNGATFYITGVQLEVGSTATPFERRLFNAELANCQRYYFKLLNTSSGNLYVSSICGAYNTTRAFGAFSLPVSMRATPTTSFSSARVGSPNLSTVDQAVTVFSNQIDAGTNQNQVFYEVNVASGLVANTFYFVKLPVSAYLDASAEL
jgi:hypothetical protein